MYLSYTLALNRTITDTYAGCIAWPVAGLLLCFLTPNVLTGRFLFDFTFWSNMRDA